MQIAHWIMLKISLSSLARASFPALKVERKRYRKKSRIWPDIDFPLMRTWWPERNGFSTQGWQILQFFSLSSVYYTYYDLQTVSMSRMQLRGGFPKYIFLSHFGTPLISCFCCHFERRSAVAAKCSVFWHWKLLAASKMHTKDLTFPLFPASFRHLVQKSKRS